MRESLQRESKSSVLIRSIPYAVVEDLDRLWETMGFSEEQITDRLDQAEIYVQDLFQRFIVEERELQEKYENEIQEHIAGIKALSIELDLEPYVYTGPTTVVQKESILKNYHNELKLMKDQRMYELRELKATEDLLCDKLNEPPAPVSAERIPNSSDINLIKENIKRLNKLRSERWSEFSELKTQMKNNYKAMSESPSDKFTTEMLGEEVDSFVALNPDILKQLGSCSRQIKDQHQQRLETKLELEKRITAVAERLQKSAGFISKLMRDDLSMEWIESLENNLRQLEEEKKTKLKAIILSIREEIRQYWDRLYYTQDQRENFIYFFNDDFSEPNCTAHEMEIERLRTYYETHKNMYDGVEKWQAMFKQYCEHREKEKDPNRFKNNRGCRLMEEIKKMNNLKKKMPKLETELIDAINVWENEHAQAFHVDGVPFQDYIEDQWGKIAEGDKFAKLERNRKKKEQLAVDMVYGTRTPTKRNLASSSRDLTKRSRLEGSMASTMSRATVSRMTIPKFRGINSSKKENEQPVVNSVKQRMRRRSKSASNLLNPFQNIKSTVRSHIKDTFRTPQPLKKSSKISQAGPVTDKPFSKRKPLRTVAEDEKMMSSFEEFEQMEYGPTSTKSAPNDFIDGQPASYEDFGGSVKKYNRSSAIGVIQLSRFGAAEL